MRARFGGLLLVSLISLAALGAAFPSAMRIPRQAGRAPSPPPALFSHRTHGTFGCYACHPTTFPQAPLSFTHAEMSRGLFCGRCHGDGRPAFAITSTTCERCHVPIR